ncbi:MAG: 3'-5' exonuclease [Propionibacteriaceae bacterium]|jgi:DNA polymerase III epsilon subunit family exonuclease|nr:3'-5' exonuclease [Propionibacteriaceae bacterium]
MTGFAVIDTETTGFAESDRVVEVGVVLLDPAFGREGTWDTLVDPGRDVGPTHVHNIRPKDVAGAPRFADVAGDLVAHMAGRIVVGHNVSFDASMLDGEFRRLGAAGLLAAAATLDTLELARNLRLSPDGVCTLDHLCEVLGLRRDSSHAALADAEATAQLFILAARVLGSKIARLGQTLEELWAPLASAASAQAWPPWPRTGLRRSRAAVRAVSQSLGPVAN